MTSQLSRSAISTQWYAFLAKLGRLSKNEMGEQALSRPRQHGAVEPSPTAEEHYKTTRGTLRAIAYFRAGCESAVLASPTNVLRDEPHPVAVDTTRRTEHYRPLRVPPVSYTHLTLPTILLV